MRRTGSGIHFQKKWLGRDLVHRERGGKRSKKIQTETPFLFNQIGKTAMSIGKSTPKGSSSGSRRLVKGAIEPQKRAHPPLLAAGLASESEKTEVPPVEDSRSLAAGRFNSETVHVLHECP
jgi:hypothetical protein